MTEYKYITNALLCSQTTDILKKHGVKFVNENEDFILAHTRPLSNQKQIFDSIKRRKKPIILWERYASSTVTRREYLLDPQVVLHIKGQCGMKDLDMYNAPVKNGRYHFSLIWHALNPEQRGRLQSSTLHIPLQQKPILTKNQLSKIKVFYGISHRTRKDLWSKLDIDFKKNRKIDVHFAGTVKYKESPLPGLHRQQALKAISNLKHVKTKHGSGFIAKKFKYLKMLLNTKIVISPWGLGDVTIRDIEAIFAGCVLVKPESDHIKTWPDMHRNGENYFACKHDFSDLQDVVDNILSNWESLADMRRQSRSMLLRTRKSEQVAVKFLEMIKGIL